MPIYEYRCAQCEAINEVIQKISDPAPETCSHCGKGPLEKQMSKTNFALKGSGWYVTDFKGGTPPKSSNSESEIQPSAAPAADSSTKSTDTPAATPPSPTSQTSTPETPKSQKNSGTSESASPDKP